MIVGLPYSTHYVWNITLHSNELSDLCSHHLTVPLKWSKSCWSVRLFLCCCFHWVSSFLLVSYFLEPLVVELLLVDGSIALVRVSLTVSTNEVFSLNQILLRWCHQLGLMMTQGCVKKKRLKHTPKSTYHWVKWRNVVLVQTDWHHLPRKKQGAPQFLLWDSNHQKCFSMCPELY